MISKKDFKKISDWLWEIPKSFRPDMRVPARVYTSEKMLEDCFRDNSLEQLVNTATLPGIVKYALVMPDAHEGYGFCLKGDTKILTDFGFHLPIKSFKGALKTIHLKVANFDSQSIVQASIQKFLRIKSKNKVLEVTTKSGHKIVATEDHPFYISQGMVALKNLGPKDKIAVLPFEGVAYEKPSKKSIISEEDIKNILLALGRKPGEVGFEQNLRVLKKRTLLSLSYEHPKLPYLLKIIGFVYGDGSMNFIGKRGDGIVHFSSKAKEDLEDIRKDIKIIGYTPSPIHCQKGKMFYKGKEKTYINYSFYVNASSLVILLQALGVPRGNKVFQPYRVPRWIFKCPLWQKRLFLASFFGAELRTPHRRKGRETMFNCPVLQINKAEGLTNNGKDFLKDIAKLLDKFGVKTIYINKRRKHISKQGRASWSLELVFSSKINSLINLWTKVGFEYNKRRTFFACVAGHYLKLKNRVLKEKEWAIKFEIPSLLKTGLSYQKIADQLATINPLTRRFIVDVCWKLNKGIKNIFPQVPVGFPTFSGFSKEVVQGLGYGGMVWDEIAAIKEIPYKGWVYDFTVDHQDHNFIANNFVVSNCIGGVAATKYPEGVISPGGVGYDISCSVRLLRSGLTSHEGRPFLERLANEIQKEVPSGLGRGRQVKLSIEQINRILEGGAKYLVEKGYGEKEDFENCEEGGQLEEADSSCVSEQAKNRGRDQVGTLGSGNHFCSIERIAEIFDERVAEVFGLFQDQIVVMVHTGSRGLGHQIATDYIKIMMQAMPKYGIRLPDRELACLPFNSDEGQKYFKAMCCGANYSWANRQMITYYVRKAWNKILNNKDRLGLIYDVAHNIAKIEEHNVDNKKMKLIVHRKGATRAFPANHSAVPVKYQSVGQPTILPGTMGTASYVMVGTEKGSESFFSTAHGAGRAMSRHAAMRLAKGEEVVRSLQKKGILVKCRSWRGIAEEAPLAYKNIDDVVEVVHQAGLSKKVAKLVPLAVIKGE